MDGPRRPALTRPPSLSSCHSLSLLPLFSLSLPLAASPLFFVSIFYIFFLFFSFVPSHSLAASPSSSFHLPIYKFVRATTWPDRLSFEAASLRRSITQKACTLDWLSTYLSVNRRPAGQPVYQPTSQPATQLTSKLTCVSQMTWPVHPPVSQATKQLTIQLPTKKLCIQLDRQTGTQPSSQLACLPASLIACLPAYLPACLPAPLLNSHTPCSQIS